MALHLMSEGELRKEAEAAVLIIADHTGWEYPGETKKRLLKFLALTDNVDHKARANRILERINQ